MLRASRSEVAVNELVSVQGSPWRYLRPPRAVPTAARAAQCSQRHDEPELRGLDVDATDLGERRAVASIGRACMACYKIRSLQVAGGQKAYAVGSRG